MNTQRYRAYCRGKYVGLIFITKNHPYLLNGLFATIIFNELNVWGFMADRMITDSFETSVKPQAIIEDLVRRINPDCLRITFELSK